MVTLRDGIITLLILLENICTLLGHIDKRYADVVISGSLSPGTMKIFVLFNLASDRATRSTVSFCTYSCSNKSPVTKRSSTFSARHRSSTASKVCHRSWFRCATHPSGPSQEGLSKRHPANCKKRTYEAILSPSTLSIPRHPLL